METDSSLSAFSGSPFKRHSMDMGKSPLATEHCAEEESPKFAGSSPKEKGTIFGGTFAM